MTYKSMGVHKNRDSSAKMKVDPVDRMGVTDSSKQAAIAAVAKKTVAKETPSTIGVDERIATGKKDTSQETTKSAHKSAAKFGASVEPGQYMPPSAPDMDMGSMMGGMGGGGGGGGGGGKGGSSGGGGGSSWGGSGGGGGGGGGGDMSSAIGESIASMDDTIDAATDKLFEDDTDIEGHQALGDALQGR